MKFASFLYEKQNETLNDRDFHLSLLAIIR